MKQLLILAFLFVPISVFSQNEKIDSLTVQITYQNQDSTKVDTALMLINELYKANDYKKAFLFINQTTKLSKELNYTKRTCW